MLLLSLSFVLEGMSALPPVTASSPGLPCLSVCVSIRCTTDWSRTSLGCPLSIGMSASGRHGEGPYTHGETLYLTTLVTFGGGWVRMCVCVCVCVCVCSCYSHPITWLCHCPLPPPGPASKREGTQRPRAVARQASQVSVSSTTANMADPGVIKPHVWQLAYHAVNTFAQPVSGLAC